MAPGTASTLCNEAQAHGRNGRDPDVGSIGFPAFLFLLFQQRRDESQRTETFPPFTSLTSGVMTTESPSFNPCLTSIPVSVVKPQTTLTRRTIPSRTVQT